MEIDSNNTQLKNEFSQIHSVDQSETSMNFDYLHGLDENIQETPMDSSPRHFGHLSSGSSNMSVVPSTSQGLVDDSRVVECSKPINLGERFVTVLDQLDARVEKLRKDALSLQEKKDFLLMSVDLIKSNDGFQNMVDGEREEIDYYIQRVTSRLATVELNVRTVRDRSQQDSLSQVNGLIDMMITLGDPVMSRQCCQQYLNSCSISVGLSCFAEYNYAPDVDVDAGPVDKKFESALLGCTLDDQKVIKKRLQALMDYLNRQMVQK